VGVTNPSRLVQHFEYLPPINDDNPDLNDWDLLNITSHEKVQLLIAIARSLGWRARYVSALEPVGRDLTIDHPLLATNVKNIFQSVYKSSDKNVMKKKKVDKRASSDANIIDLVDSDDCNNEQKKDSTLTNNNRSKDQTNEIQFTKDELGWVEILCRPNNTTQSKKSLSSRKHKTSVSSPKKPSSVAPRWIHIDPQRELFDEPLTMESVLFSLQRDDEGTFRKENKKSKRGMVNMSYVLAVEHPILTPEYEEASLSEGINMAPSHDNNDSRKNRLRSARIMDVTPRYANAWSKTLRLRGATGVQIASGRGKCVDSWWAETIRKSNRLFKRLGSSNISNNNGERPQDSNVAKTKQKTISLKDTQQTPVVAKQIVLGSCENDGMNLHAVDCSSSCNSQRGAVNNGQSSDEDQESDLEKDELQLSTKQETIPTSKAAFKKHPLYVIPSVMLSTEVLAPDARKRICGVFKGQLVYKRSDVSTALAAKKWLYKGRKVKDNEMGKPAKKVKARKKPISTSFQELGSYGISTKEQSIKDAVGGNPSDDTESDGMERLYGIWQTDAWSPKPVGPDEDIPANEYRNVELALLNPGLVHLEQRGMSKVAKRLGIPYAPCLLGFEGHGGNRTPTIRGIVVHAHNTELLNEAFTEWESQSLEQEHKKRQTEIHRRWKRLVVGLLTKERLDREYGGESKC